MTDNTFATSAATAGPINAYDTARLADARSAWREVTRHLCPEPGVRTWRSLSGIVSALDLVGRRTSYSYLHYNHGGSQQMMRARRGAEPRTIAIDVHGDRKILRPKELQLVRHVNDVHDEFSYLRLELANLETTGLDPDMEGWDQEHVMQVKRGEYALLNGVGDDYYTDLGGVRHGLTRHARPVVRCLHGTLLIVPRYSFFQQGSSWKKGTQSKMSASELFALVTKLVTGLNGESILGC